MDFLFGVFVVVVVVVVVLFVCFYNGPYAGFVYLEMAGNRSCRPPARVHIQQLNFLL